MEDWTTDWVQAISKVAEEVDQFFAEMTQEAIQVVDDLSKFSEAILEQLYEEFDQSLEEWVTPMIQVLWGLEDEVDGLAEPLIQTVDPVLNDHPVCSGCRHYHGQVYGGNLLVCAMHPYGWDQEQCPDWQSTWNE